MSVVTKDFLLDLSVTLRRYCFFETQEAENDLIAEIVNLVKIQENPCETCKGQGAVEDPLDPEGNVTACPDCDGKGTHEQEER